jgi:hypothetical protein
MRVDTHEEADEGDYDQEREDHKALEESLKNTAPSTGNEIDESEEDESEEKEEDLKMIDLLEDDTKTPILKH